MIYSKSTGGFYDQLIHGANIPADAVVITDAEYNALLDGQSTGRYITADASGNPVLTDPQAPTPAQLVVAFQQSAQDALSATDSTFARIQEAITLGLVPAVDPTVVAWIDYRKALRAEIKAISVGTLAVKPTTYPAGT